MQRKFAQIWVDWNSVRGLKKAIPAVFEITVFCRNRQVCGSSRPFMCSDRAGSYSYLLVRCVPTNEAWVWGYSGHTCTSLPCCLKNIRSLSVKKKFANWRTTLLAEHAKCWMYACSVKGGVSYQIYQFGVDQFAAKGSNCEDCRGVFNCDTTS